MQDSNKFKFKNKMRKYLPTIGQLIDRLSIVTLKSIKIKENKEEYEKEAQEIMADLTEIFQNINPNEMGNFIRAIQVNGIINEIIWSNEAFVRQGEGNITNKEIANRLTLTHSLNRVRNQAMNVISQIVGERKDLKLDYIDAEKTKKYGYDFKDILT